MTKTRNRRKTNVLILTRKVGESLIIDGNIRVAILEIRGKQVRLGIEAPADIVVLREEIFQRLIHENLQAAGFQPADLEAVLQSMGCTLPEPGSFEQLPLVAPAITIDSKNLGRITVREDDILTFTQGLLGARIQHYVLLEDPRMAPFGFLQAVEDPGLALVVMEPAKLVPDYKPGPQEGVLKELEAKSLQDLKVLVVLTIPPGRPREMTANLQCPILINPNLRRGKQVILESPHYYHEYPLLPDTEGS